jgi:hypothetical protein
VDVAGGWIDEDGEGVDDCGAALGDRLHIWFILSCLDIWMDVDDGDDVDVSSSFF